MNFDEQSLVEHKDFEPRHYMFKLRLYIDKSKLMPSNTIKRLRFYITYGDILIKDWREEYKKTRGEEYISQPCLLEFFSKNKANLPIKVTMQVIDKSKNIVQCASDEYSFLESATSLGTPIHGNRDEDQIIQICLDEGLDEREYKNLKKHYSYKLIVEYAPNSLP